MPLNCDNCRERLLGYLYEELDADERSAVEEALSRCPDCQRELAAMRTVGRAFDTLPRAEFPEKRTLDLIREARLAADARKRPSRVALWLGSLATVSALGVIGLVSVLRSAAPEMAQHDQFAAAPASPTAQVPAATEASAPPAAVAAAPVPTEGVAEETPEAVAGVVGENGIVAPDDAPADSIEDLAGNVVGGMARDTVARAEESPAMPMRGAGGAEPEEPELFERQQQAMFGTQREEGALGAGDLGGSRAAPGGDANRYDSDLENEDGAEEIATRTATVTSPVVPAPTAPYYAPPAPRPETESAPSAAAPVDSAAAAWGTSPTTATTGSVAQGYGGAPAQPAPATTSESYADRTVAVADEAEADSVDRRERRREQERDNSSGRTSAAPSAEQTMLDGDSDGLAQAGEDIDSAVSASLYDEAQNALASGLYANADEYFAAFLELAQAGDRRITGAYLGRARCAAALGRTDSARAFVESMLARNPTDDERRQAAELLDRLDAPAQYNDDVPYNRALESAEPPSP